MTIVIRIEDVFDGADGAAQMLRGLTAPGEQPRVVAVASMRVKHFPAAIVHFGNAEVFGERMQRQIALEAAAIAAVAGLAVRDDGNVADLGGIAVRALVRGAVHHERAAEAHAEMHVEEIVEILRDAKQRFAQRAGHAVHAVVTRAGR